MAKQQKSTWYSQWFDSEYYHILYENHDFLEAEGFIDKLTKKLSLPLNSTVADIACGRGRHALYLSKKGFNVTGLDLSPRSIEFAKKMESDQLNFHVHDMRKVFAKDKFDLVLNLFTSFGYFEDNQDNFNAIAAMAASCKKDGLIVIDFMNTSKVLNHLVTCDTKVAQHIHFDISKSIIDNFIVKKINFTGHGNLYQFEERVRIIYQKDFMEYFKFAKLKVKKVYGSYDLKPYDEKESDRMIFVLSKL